MELPSALERVLGALLNDHCVTSWKVTSEGQTPTVVLRLKPVSEHQDYVTTHVYYETPFGSILAQSFAQSLCAELLLCAKSLLKVLVSR